ncbi:MAG: FAD-linked oxidase C-terminal domain-containing protein [Candidatus Eisenbacteria bacterium]|nr:FAD-linked oxidase C-terminal domain-containing protein [Candidatus Eisenbacteria bacterium]
MLSDALLKKLRKELGQENVLTSDEELVCHSYDATLIRSLPDAVVTPRTAEDVSKVLVLANENAIPVTPRGSGTGLTGGSVPLRGGIVLCLTKMNSIREIAPADLLAVVEPGVVTGELQRKLEEEGLFYPPDPASLEISSIGGNIGNSAGGPRGFKYGMTKDYILGLEVVLPTGELVKTGARTVKCVTGYDLARLFTGSEGTLGVITSAILRLIPVPEERITVLASFKRLEDAASLVSEAVSAGLAPSALEIMDSVTLSAVKESSGLNSPEGTSAVVLSETDGFSEVAMKEAQKVRELSIKNGAISVQMEKDKERREKLWAARRGAFAALARKKPTTILEDIVVPRTKLVEMVRAVAEIGRRHQLVIATYGHAGDGNLHPTILCDKRDEDEMRRAGSAAGEIFERALDLGGTLSGEHGIGFEKARFLKKEIGEAGIKIMKRLKDSFDPKGIMNPGKMFE